VSSLSDLPSSEKTVSAMLSAVEMCVCGESAEFVCARGDEEKCPRASVAMHGNYV
jgi:hypothetical protein